MGHRQATLYVAVIRMFVPSRFLSAFMVILGDFYKTKFIWGTSLIFSTFIWSYVAFSYWRQKDE